MVRARTIVLATLLLAPLLIYAVLAGYSIWQSGLAAQVWWYLPICWALTWLIARLWKTTPAEHAYPLSPANHWTDRDRAAAEIVRRYQLKIDQLSPQQLTDPHFIFEEMKSLAQELSRHYHPRAEMPVESLTVPEVLAAVRLAITDTERWTLDSAPGSQLLTIGQWRSFRHAPKWIRRIQNTTWATWVLMNPANLALYVSSRYTTEPVTSGLQSELLMLFYARLVREIGFYLIEMNSGRLRAGADAYLQNFAADRTEQVQQRRDAVARSIGPEDLTIAVVGQVNSGKSSLINALTGNQSAAVDVLPRTSEVKRYSADIRGMDLPMQLLDTPGYADVGATADQMKQIEIALRGAHAVLLMMDAHTAAREADRAMIAALGRWYSEHQNLKRSPVIGVLTHVDLLPPTLIWNLPCDWQQPASEKEKRIGEAVAYTKTVFANGMIDDVVPVCLSDDPARRWGISEQLIPSLLGVLPDAQCVALLRAYEQQVSNERFETLVKQVKSACGIAIRQWIEMRLDSEKRFSDKSAGV